MGMAPLLMIDSSKARKHSHRGVGATGLPLSRERQQIGSSGMLGCQSHRYSYYETLWIIVHMRKNVIKTIRSI